MKRTQLAFLLLAASAAAAVVACTETTTTQDVTPNEPTGTSSSSGTSGSGSGSSDDEDDQQPGTSSGTTPKKDAGGSSSSSSSGGSTKDAGPDSSTPPPPDAGPTVVPFTKAEVQTLFNARCAPCHTTQASAGLSLATDFTTNTVGVNSSQVATLKRIKAGDKNNSYLFHKIKGTHASVGGTGLRMPRNGPPYLSDSDIARIGAYIDGI